MCPVIFEIPLPFELFGSDTLPIRGFGLMVVIALLVGNAVMVRLGRREGVPEEPLANLFLLLVVSIVAGARLFYVVTNWGQFADRPLDIIMIQKGGMVFYGSFLAIVASLAFWCRKNKLNFLCIADIIGVGAAIGTSIGRIGCLLVGDDYGKPVDEGFPLGIKFSTATEDGSFLGITIPAGNGNLAGQNQGLWLHPSQVYMSLNALVMFGLLMLVWKKKTRHGQVMAAFFLYYAVSRSVIELFRGDEDRGFVGPLSTSQFVSVFVFLSGLALFWLARRGGPVERVDPAREAPAAAGSKDG